MSVIAGIDSGSTTTALILFSGSTLLFRVGPTGADSVRKTRELLGDPALFQFVHTGYHRELLARELGGKTISEIRAFALGAFHLHPGCRTVIDLGGQDTKVINLSRDGRVKHFELNDRCAAGTGRFLEVMARALEVELGDLIEEALKAPTSVAINPMCTVFAESEVISLIARGEPRSSVSLGLHQAIASRILGLLHRLEAAEPIIFAGGGARNRCLHRLLENILKKRIIVPERPQFVGALGAVIHALQQTKVPDLKVRVSKCLKESKNERRAHDPA